MPLGPLDLPPCPGKQLWEEHYISSHNACVKVFTLHLLTLSLVSLSWFLYQTGNITLVELHGGQIKKFYSL